MSLLILLLLAFFMSMLFLSCNHSIHLRYLYYLVIINMLPFNRRFLMLFLGTVLENNQLLTDVFKNVKM